MEPRDNDLSNLHPLVADKFRWLAERLDEAYRAGSTRSLFRPFEAYRSPRRQRQLLAHKPPVTKAGAWESSHQYGCAVDFVAYDEVGRRWSWAEDEDWPFLKATAERIGLQVPIAWDRPHVEASGLFKAMRKAAATWGS